MASFNGAFVRTRDLIHDLGDFAFHRHVPLLKWQQITGLMTFQSTSTSAYIYISPKPDRPTDRTVDCVRRDDGRCSAYNSYSDIRISRIFNNIVYTRMPVVYSSTCRTRPTITFLQLSFRLRSRARLSAK